MGIADTTRFVRLFDVLGREGSALDAFVACYGANAVFEDPVQRIEGRAAIERGLRAFFGAARFVDFDVTRYACSEDEAFVEWRMRYAPRFGPAIVAVGTSVVTFADGCVVRHRDYFDLVETLRLTLPFRARAAPRAT